MSKILFWFGRDMKRLFGPQRSDLRLGTDRVVIHLHRYGERQMPLLYMSVVVPRWPKRVDSCSFIDIDAFLGEAYKVNALKRAPVLALVDKANAISFSGLHHNPNNCPEYREVCAQLGLDPDCRSGSSGGMVGPFRSAKSEFWRRFPRDWSQRFNLERRSRTSGGNTPQSRCHIRAFRHPVLDRILANS